MKKTVIIILAIFTLSCTEQKVDTKIEGDKVMQLSKEWSEVASKGDVNKTLNYWAEDAILISAGQPPLIGKNEISKMVEESFKIPGFRISWQPKSVVVSKSGDLAYMIEDSQMSFLDSTGNTITENNNAVSIWRKEADGSWKNILDISTPKPMQNK
jgi:uncharacterized protein (TIGR02246 family)